MSSGSKRLEPELAQPSMDAYGILMIRTICHGTGYGLVVKTVVLGINADHRLQDDARLSIVALGRSYIPCLNEGAQKVDG